MIAVRRVMLLTARLMSACGPLRTLRLIWRLSALCGKAAVTGSLTTREHLALGQC